MSYWQEPVGWLESARRAARRAGRTALVVALTGLALPAWAEDANLEARIRRVEAETRALQRKVFSQGEPAATRPSVGEIGVASAVSPKMAPAGDLVLVLNALKASIAELKAAVDQNNARIALLETTGRVGAPNAVQASAAAKGDAASSAKQDIVLAPTAPSASRRASRSIPRRNGAAAPVLAVPSGSALAAALRPAALRPISKPQTGDDGEDEYSYGFRLWQAKAYPEAQQQLKSVIDRHPQHARVSYARNLLGRAYLDAGDARTAAQWFFHNYQTDKRGARAADSLLGLAEAMRRLGDVHRTCLMLAEFDSSYPDAASGRLKAEYDRVRAAAKCG